MSGFAILAFTAAIVGVLYLFRRFEQIKKQPPVRLTVAQAESILDSLPEYQDFLGRAAIAYGEAKDAIREGEHDKAWGLLHEVKGLYLGHAQQYGMTAREALALESSVHADMANILRKEGKHDQAFIHLFYCYGATGGGVNKSEAGKFRAYFNRCRLAPVTLEQAQAALTDLKSNPSFESAQEAFSKLKAESEK